MTDLIARIIRAPGPDYDLGRAAWWGDDGYLHGIHLTDDPSHVRETLRAAIPLPEGRTRREKYGDLGPGLYVSAAPQLWQGRSSGKWSFLKTLQAPELKDRREMLSTAILADLRRRGPRYLSESEVERAVKRLAAFIDDGDTYIVDLADQPYNVNFWTPEFLKPLGIIAGTQAIEVEVIMRGRFAELRWHPTTTEIDRLQHGRFDGELLDGAYTRSGFATYPQLVVWHNEAVVQFG